MSNNCYNDTLLQANAVDFKRYREDDIGLAAVDVRLHYLRSLLLMYFSAPPPKKVKKAVCSAWLLPSMPISWEAHTEVFNLTIPQKYLLETGAHPGFLVTFQGENAIIAPDISTKLEVSIEDWNKKEKEWCKLWEELTVTDMPSLMLHIISINNSLHSFYTI